MSAVPTSYTRWTKDEDAVLREHFAKHGRGWDGWALVLPGRSQQAIYTRASKLGLSSGRRPAPARVVRVCKDCSFWRERGLLPGAGVCACHRVVREYGRMPVVLATTDAGECPDWSPRLGKAG